MSELFSRHSDIHNFNPQEFEDLLGPPPLSAGEDANEYFDIGHRMLESIRPENYIERWFVIDLIDLTYEILCLRRVKVALASASWSYAIETLLERGLLVGAPPGAETLLRIEAKLEARRWRTDESAQEEIEDRLRDLGLDENHIEVEAFMQCLLAREALDKRLTSAQQRRNALLRDIGVHRELARRARQVSDKVIENIPKLPPGQE